MATVHTIKIDAVRSVLVKVEGSKVNLSLLALGINTFSQPIDVQTAKALGAALCLAAEAAAKGGEA